MGLSEITGGMCNEPQHGEGVDVSSTLTKVALVTAAIFFGSIALWAIGASIPAAGLVIVGKIGFSLCCVTAGLLLIGGIATACICKDMCKDQLP